MERLGASIDASLSLLKGEHKVAGWGGDAASSSHIKSSRSLSTTCLFILLFLLIAFIITNHSQKFNSFCMSSVSWPTTNRGTTSDNSDPLFQPF